MLNMLQKAELQFSLCNFRVVLSTAYHPLSHLLIFISNIRNENAFLFYKVFVSCSGNTGVYYFLLKYTYLFILLNTAWHFRCKDIKKYLFSDN